MSSVTELRRTRLHHLAEVSGAPRPVLLPSPRAPEAGPATVTALRRSDTIEDGARTAAAPPVVAPLAAPSPATPRPPGPALGEARPALAGEELSHRISGIARSVAQGALEVLGGSRPLQQLARWLDPESYERLQLRANLVRCITAAPTSRGETPTSTHRHVIIRSARVCPVSDTVFEASVVAFDQRRVRAVALRIELRRGAWRVTALEIG